MIRLRSLVAPLAALALTGGAAGCTPTEGPDDRAAAPVYLGVETRLLQDDLVNFVVALERADGPEAVDDYARCAAAQYALIRGYGFARHVRTRLAQEGGIWKADAVYTISPALPRGALTIDAEVVVDQCRRDGIPTV
ncbi:hypothetical protein Ga0609869_002835 [Rhodovulum iodosum]|uniref:Lipoprotein n=1 Tax=Rhodovulum iodosum TaxID=68291 RepID=A0ABV3XVV2_9RHOB|nr:hypothetical protein [Rhodovulum robiginosum]RSK36409.1 hypothetical protein EJA01_05020 [Rhodovulum robiginosum]